MNRTFLYLILMNNGEDKNVSRILSSCLHSGICKISTDSHYINVEFSNGVKACLWNRNKYYSWLSEGKFIDANSQIIYQYHNARPSRKVMWMLCKAITDYWETKFKNYRI